MIGGRKFIIALAGMILAVLQPDVASHIAVIASAYIAGNAVLGKARAEAGEDETAPEEPMEIGFRHDGIEVADHEEEDVAP